MSQIEVDGKRMMRLNRRLKRWIEGEKENYETEFYAEMSEIREHALVALRLYRRLKRQQFVHYRDEEELFELAEIAVKKFNAFVMEHSIPPDTNDHVPFDVL